MLKRKKRTALKMCVSVLISVNHDCPLVRCCQTPEKWFNLMIAAVIKWIATGGSPLGDGGRYNSFGACVNYWHTIIIQHSLVLIWPSVVPNES